MLECVGGEVLEKSVRCLSSYGRLVSYGNASGVPANLPFTDITSANRTVIGFSMGRSPVGSLDHQSAMEELELILQKLDSSEVNIDSLTVDLQRASELIEWCRSRLESTKVDVERIVADLEER